MTNHVVPINDSQRIAHLEKLGYGMVAGIKVSAYLLSVIGVMIAIALASAGYLYRKDTAKLERTYSELSVMTTELKLTSAQFQNHVDDPRDHVNSTPSILALEIRLDTTDEKIEGIEEHYHDLTEQMDEVIELLRTNHPGT